MRSAPHRRPLSRRRQSRTAATQAAQRHALVHVLLACTLVLLWLAWVFGAHPASAQGDAALTIEILAPDALALGARQSIPVRVRLPKGEATPLLLTPKAEGSAVEVVRGRLSREDGEAQEDGALVFLVPVLSRSEGTAILRIDVMTYVCEARCRRVTKSESYVLRVRSGG